MTTPLTDQEITVKLLDAREHLFQTRCLLRDLYAVHNGTSYVYLSAAAQTAVDHTYDAERFVDSMLDQDRTVGAL